MTELDFRFGHMDKCYAHLEWFGSSMDKKYVIYLNYTVEVDGQDIMLTLAGIQCGDDRDLAIAKFERLRDLLVEDET